MMPSERHNRLAIMGLRWLRGKATGRGIRGGFEVPVAHGYVADAVGLCAFQHRFAQCYIGEEHFERVDAFTSLVPEVACIFEAKATRQDFLATFGDGHRHANRRLPVGSLHWCVCTKGIAAPDELPDFWGLLQTRGAGLTEIRKPRFLEASIGTLHRLAYQSLWYAKNNHERFVSAVYDEMNH